MVTCVPGRALAANNSAVWTEHKEPQRARMSPKYKSSQNKAQGTIGPKMVPKWAQKWVPKSFEQAIRCFEQAGLVAQVSGIEKQYAEWQQ